ncbi:uncharacterized protein LOC114915594 [Cajanus cajan]|uniref:uncharacterized protein LOC114915593 n=1 Tax=Cajanus cajan TaxID=3821 RepID=UPI0010FB76FB|nr:uncharacterized protein LOC114915593 [Cajanus cajan]XP_029126297.1 uncharacterized protein LOC114915594 [Cajanus cajan]
MLLINRAGRGYIEEVTYDEKNEYLAFLILMMPTFYMDDVGASSQSSLPTVNPEPPEPHPDPDLSLPLLDDNTRRAELDERAGFHFVELSEDKKDKVLKAQVQIERAIEKALLSDGYSRDELSQRNKRDEIRAFLFYPKGKLLSIKTYESYVKEVEFGTHRSQPYKVLIKAISSSHLFLQKVKKIKRWERG